VLLRRIAKLEVDLHHVGVTGDITLPDRVVVARALVDVLDWLRAHRDRLELDDGHGHVQLHDLRLTEVLLLFVPFATLKEEAVDVGTILRALLELLNLLCLRDEVELEPVNRRRVLLSREALKERGGETGRESECTDPEANWLALCHPRFKEVVAIAQILLPVAKGLSAEVGEAPLARHLVLSE